MARTHGHGNPNWSRDETILALNLYFECARDVPDASDARVVRVSEILRQLPLHITTKRTETFRNPDGVAFKLQNLHNVATGKGLKHVAEMDREVWSDFGAHPEIVKGLAEAIVKGARQLEASEVSEDESDVVFIEGRVLTRIHKLRERAPGLRKRLLETRLSRGAAVCDMCSRRSAAQDQRIADACFEVHHVVPLSAATERTTRLADLALLCASCHRILHRAIADRGCWIGFPEAKQLVLPPDHV
jgi:5-methylcytosine-specific restriction protein A